MDISGSAVELDTATVLERIPGMLGETVNMIVALSVGAKVPMLQIMAVVPLQLPRVEDADTNAVPEGSASVTSTLAADAGPDLFVTVMV